MNFFEAQDRARRASKWLVVVYLVSTVLIVAGVTVLAGLLFYSLADPASRGAHLFAQQSPLLGGIATLTTLFILGATLFKTAALSSGGGKVAQQLGGTQVPADVSDPLRRRLRNVVEEMAIASGIPVPEIYVLEEESAINAFAAGYAPGDAAVAVTRGTLELLNRDELQGVIAHEFSHILNGDMRLNIRMMGVLFGILALGLIGRMVMRGGYHANVISSSRDRSAPVVLMVGLGLIVIGSVGVFFARLIKAAVSRQREYLADASAVQFTRQSEGIANALKKIGGYREASYLRATDPEEVSHMLFGSGARLAGLFATHPPLTARIQALDPAFRPDDYPHVTSHGMHSAAGIADDADDPRLAGISAAMATGGTVVLPESIAESVGAPDVEHVEYAEQLRASIPEALYAAAHSPEFSYLLTIALILDRSGRHHARQLQIVAERLGQSRTSLIADYYDQLGSTGPEYRLPLLEVAFPALKQRPAAQLKFLIDLATRLIEVDGVVDLYEYCYYRILTSSLGQAVDPKGRRKATRAPRRALRQAAVDLVNLVASEGHEDAAERQSAMQAGFAELGDWAGDLAVVPAQELDVPRLDKNLDILLALNGKGRRRLLRAISAAAASDDRLTVAEAELIRVVCATLDCPLPPILVRTQPIS